MNTCDVGDLDVDNLLPPRKRLLAGLKRQSSDVNFRLPSPSNSPGNEFDARLNHVMRSLLSNPNMSNVEIVEASRRAATEAAKFAEGARANAEDKAAKAAKAVAAAKNALELVATLSEKASKKAKRMKKNKLKKQIPVESLYNKSKRKTNCRTDEELARNLHRSINSSPRISKNFPVSDLKNKHKRIKTSVSFKKIYAENEGPAEEGNRPSIPTNHRNGIVGEADLEGPVKEIDMITVDLNSSKYDKVGLNCDDERGPSKTDQTKLKNGEVDSLLSENSIADSSDFHCKKRGRVKQKKLPLSICSFRDQTGSKELQKPKDMHQSEGNSRRAVGNQSLFTDNSAMWKCQSFKAATVVEQNKVMQSQRS